MAQRKREPEPAPALAALNVNQRKFVYYYLGESKGSATDAARRAGYAQPHSQGPRLLEHVGIRNAIEAAIAEDALASEEVLMRVSDMATADMADFLTITKKEARLDLAKARKLGKTHLIKKLRPTRYGLAIELCDPLAALALLGKYHRLWDRDAPADEDEEGLPDDKMAARALKAVDGDDDAPGAPEHPAGDA